MLEYTGAAYSGFQRQGGKATIQMVMEEAVEELTRQRVTVAGSGRTDAGTHACAQVVAFSCRTELAPAVLRRALNAILPSDVAVTSVQDVSDTFHPRYNAYARTYRYVIHNRPIRSPFWHDFAAHVSHPLDADAMHSAAQVLVGEHDFSAFVPAAYTGSRIRLMFSVSCRRRGEVVVTDLKASGFMRQMARSIMGSLLRVGEGKANAADVRAALFSRNRHLGGQTMPARGLYLTAVHYLPEILVLGHQPCDPGIALPV